MPQTATSNPLVLSNSLATNGDNDPITISIQAAATSIGSDKPNDAIDHSTESDGQKALDVWKRASATIDGMLADFVGRVMRVECTSADHWIAVFPPGSNKSIEVCETPARKAEMQTALNAIAGRSIRFDYRVEPGKAVMAAASELPVSPAVARSQRMRQLSEHPYVSKLCELLQGEITRIDPPQDLMRPNQSQPTEVLSDHRSSERS